MWEFGWISNARSPRRRASPPPGGAARHLAPAMGEDIRGLSIKEFAARTNVSVASVHRFCKKLGLEGFKDLKVELIRLATEAGNRRDVDINFPFDATSTPAQVMERIKGSTRPRWPKRRNYSTPRSLTTPPSSSQTPDRSTSTRARTTSIQQECSATACSPPAKAQRATTALRPRCVRRSPRVPTMRQSSSPTAALPQPQGHLADSQQPACPGHRHRHALLRSHSPWLCRLPHGK